MRKIAKDGGLDLEFVRHGSNHDQYRIGTTLLPVPRHREIKEGTANAILKDALAATKG
jgi:predicted RNA binding protein YcfA (HicA-like mRNA interferase family)